MKTAVCVVVLICCFFGSAESRPEKEGERESPLRWSVKPGLVKQGQRAIMVCQGRLESPDDVIKVDRHVDGKVFPLYTGSKVVPEMRRRVYARVNFTYAQESYVALLLYDVVGKDACEYKCYLASSPAQSVSLPLSVASSIQMVSFYNTEPNQKGQTLQLRRWEPSGIECVTQVRGEAPRMQVLFNEREDITHLFTPYTQTTEHLLLNGEIDTRRTVYLRYETSDPAPLLKQGRISCHVVLPHDEASISTILSVFYQPHIECEQQEYLAKVGDRLTIRCSVLSQPKSRVAWKFSVESWLQLLTRHQGLGKRQALRGDPFSIRSFQKGDKSVHELTIASLEAKDFKEYRLEATNALATANASLRVVSL